MGNGNMKTLSEIKKKWQLYEDFAIIRELKLSNQPAKVEFIRQAVNDLKAELNNDRKIQCVFKEDMVYGGDEFGNHQILGVNISCPNKHVPHYFFRFGDFTDGHNGPRGYCESDHIYIKNHDIYKMTAQLGKLITDIRLLYPFTIPKTPKVFGGWHHESNFYIGFTNDTQSGQISVTNKVWDIMTENVSGTEFADMMENTMKSTNPPILDKFGDILNVIKDNMDRMNFDTLVGNEIKTLYHEFSHLHDRVTDVQKFYNRDLEWDKRDHEFDADINSLILSLVFELEEAPLDVIWSNDSEGYHNILNQFWEELSRHTKKKKGKKEVSRNVLKRLIRVRSFLSELEDEKVKSGEWKRPEEDSSTDYEDGFLIEKGDITNYYEFDGLNGFLILKGDEKTVIDYYGNPKGHKIKYNSNSFIVPYDDYNDNDNLSKFYSKLENSETYKQLKYHSDEIIEKAIQQWEKKARSGKNGRYEPEELESYLKQMREDPAEWMDSLDIDELYFKYYSGNRFSSHNASPIDIIRFIFKESPDAKSELKKIGVDGIEGEHNDGINDEFTFICFFDSENFVYNRKTKESIWESEIKNLRDKWK